MPPNLFGKPVSLGCNIGKAVIMLPGNLVTTAVTADQVIQTYTITVGKMFYLEYVMMMARLTTYASTATLFGMCSLESPAGTKLFTLDMAAPAGVTNFPNIAFLSEPIPFAGGTVIRMVCTPAAATSFTWKTDFGGYEK